MAYDVDDEPDEGDDGGLSEQPIADDDADVDEEDDWTDEDLDEEEVVARSRRDVGRSDDRIHAESAMRCA